LVQADYGPESGTSGLRVRRAPWLALLLAGCSSFPASMNPVSWWHDLQGGKIAEERPPPPGADQPYPNLASVPPKPEAPARRADDCQTGRSDQRAARRRGPRRCGPIAGRARGAVRQGRGAAAAARAAT
jgi:hypothetical protein